MASILLRVIVLVCQGELLFLWGAVLYSLFWYGSHGDGKIARAARGLARVLTAVGTACFCFLKWIWPALKHFVESIWPYAVLFGIGHLLISAFLHSPQRGQSGSSSLDISATRYPPAAPAPINAMLRAPVPTTACPVPGHPAYSYEHEINLLADINESLEPIDHDALSNAAFNNDQDSKQLVAAKEKVRQSLMFLRNTAVPSWINKQRQEMHNQDHESVQATVSKLQTYHKDCMDASSRALGEGGTADLLAQVISGLSHEAQLGLTQAPSGDAQHDHALHLKKLLDKASKSLVLLTDMLSDEACFTSHVNTLIGDWLLVSRSTSSMCEQDLQSMQRLRSHWPVITTGLRWALSRI